MSPRTFMQAMTYAAVPVLPVRVACLACVEGAEHGAEHNESEVGGVVLQDVLVNPA
jgi:hypothetical protein